MYDYIIVIEVPSAILWFHCHPFIPYGFNEISNRGRRDFHSKCVFFFFRVAHSQTYNFTALHKDKKSYVQQQLLIFFHNSLVAVQHEFRVSMNEWFAFPKQGQLGSGFHNCSLRGNSLKTVSRKVLLGFSSGRKHVLPDKHLVYESRTGHCWATDTNKENLKATLAQELQRIQRPHRDMTSTSQPGHKETCRQKDGWPQKYRPPSQPRSIIKSILTFHTKSISSTTGPGWMSYNIECVGCPVVVSSTWGGGLTQ